MAPQNRRNAGQFKKGKSGNPGGRQRLTPEARAIQNLTREQYIRMANALHNVPPQRLIEIASDPETPSLMVWMAQAILKGQENGDLDSLDKYMNRVIGKVPDQMDLQVNEPFIIERRDGSEVIMGVKEKEDE
jgi:hypothetical protein